MRHGLRYATVALSAALFGTQFPVSIAAATRCGKPPSVLLDIGHTPKNPGATSARGKTEYSFNRRLALELAPALRVLGFDVETLNEKGKEILLSARGSELGAIKNGIILSLHHDAVQPKYLERGLVDGKPAQFSRYEKAKGYSLFVSGRSAAFERSKALALDIGSELREAGFTPSMHHAEKIKGEGRSVLDGKLGLFQYDGLAVLKSTRVPALLLEAGVIVNPEEELDLEDPTRHARLVRAVAKGIASFCDLPLNENAAPAGQETPKEGPPVPR